MAAQREAGGDADASLAAGGEDTHPPLRQRGWVIISENLVVMISGILDLSAVLSSLVSQSMFASLSHTEL